MSAMSATAKPPSILPEVLPILPLSGVVLLPRARLPLNIFEPRYLELIEDMLGQGRMIGMIQPTGGVGDDAAAVPVYRIGCAGRITSFTESEGNRFLVEVTGVCRFAISEELPPEKLYRRVRPDWQCFLDDLSRVETGDTVDRAQLKSALQPYFKMHDIAVDWDAVQNAPSDLLISSLVMICPLPPNEKQALLEAPDLAARAAMLTALLAMASMPQNESEGGAKH
jgi:uncharacterized protein